MNSKDVVLLLTASVNPDPSLPFLKRADSKIRMNDYLKSMQRWLSHKSGITKIVFCENTETDIRQIKTLTDSHSRFKEIEILQFKPPRFNPALGKGYGEGLIIEHAINNSIILKRNSVFAKVTGRLYIKNLSSIIAGIPQGAHVGAYMKANLLEVVLQSIVFDIETYKKHFMELYKEVNDTEGIYLEKLVARKIIELIPKGLRYQPFCAMPYLVGYTATDNKKINTLSYYMKHKVAGLLKSFSRL
jgi:hypothetical protein